MAAFQQPPSATLPPPSTTHHAPRTTHRFLPQTAISCALTSWVPRRLLNRSTTPKRGTPKMAPSAPHQLHPGQYPAAMAINILFPTDHPSSVQHCPHSDLSATPKLSDLSSFFLLFSRALKPLELRDSCVARSAKSVSHASSSVAQCQQPWNHDRILLYLSHRYRR